MDDATTLHPTLRRQLRQCFGSLQGLSEDCRQLIELVNETYHQADRDRDALQDSLKWHSEELTGARAQLNRAVEEIIAAQREMEARVRERTQELDAAHERLRQAQKMEAVGQLAGGIAHDFNNLLTAMLGYCELVLDRARNDVVLAADVEEIKKAGQRATRLTRQLLAFSRKQILVPQVLDLNHVVGDLQEMLSRVIGADIRLELSTSADLSHTKADRGQIEQLLMNLVVNARDAMPQGGSLRISTANVELDTDFVRKHAGATAGRYVSLTVQDTGCGMGPEILAHVFEPFFTTKGAGKGTGLGLATVYGIVKQSGGYITVESEPGRGSTFTTYLAAVDEPIEPVADVLPVRNLSGTETVLLVEDERPVREFMRRTLIEYGYTVLEAGTGIEALAIASRHEGDIQLLATDIVMPEMSGPNLAQHIVLDWPDIKVLYVSGFPQAVMVSTGWVSHTKARFLAKPFTAISLATAVRECLDGASGSDDPAGVSYGAAGQSFPPKNSTCSQRGDAPRATPLNVQSNDVI